MYLYTLSIYTNFIVNIYLHICDMLNIVYLCVCAYMYMYIKSQWMVNVN